MVTLKWFNVSHISAEMVERLRPAPVAGLVNNGRGTSLCAAAGVVSGWRQQDEDLGKTFYAVLVLREPVCLPFTRLPTI